MDPDPSGVDSLHVSGCMPQLEFDTAISIATNGRIPISEGVKAASRKGKFQLDNRSGCEKYNDSYDDEWFLGFDEKGIDVYMKHCKVFIEHIEDKYKKTENKVVHVEREEERDREVKMMVRRRLTKEVRKLVMRCFYQRDPTRRGYRKRMIAIWRDKETFEITEQRLVDQAKVIRTNKWLTEVELEEIRRKFLTPRDNEENINGIHVIEERIQNENGPMEPK